MSEIRDMPGLKCSADHVRSYERAIQIINSRRRVARPQEANILSTVNSTPASSPTPDLRGTPGIEGMSCWLEALGHSGKGSTCAFTEAFLRAHGKRIGYPKKTGLYTSPHLVVPGERIRIDSQPLPETLFVKYFFEVCDRLPQLADEFDPSKEVVQRGPRYLQLFALLAFHTFIREGVDVAIFETHCGGEYDATNVVQRPAVAAQAFLDRCAPESCKDLTVGDLEAGVQHYSWPGRFQTLLEEQWTWYLDAAHNGMSVRIAAEWFAETCRDSRRGSSQPCILIFSHINELRGSEELLKSLGEALNAHKVHINHVIFSTYDESTSRKSHQSPDGPESFRRVWQKLDPNSSIWSEPTIQGAIRLARQLGPDGMHTLITGSQHLVGPSLRVLNWTPKTAG